MMKRNISSSIFYTVALALVLLLGSQASQAFVTIGVSINVAPPELPVYEQPAVPGPGYMWTPGYWAWSADAGSYYWVPGTWVEAPQPGYLWTPGYWGWNDGLYVWNGGYWGTHIGFYGGVNYGFGYGGHGYEGGYWDHGAFQYNSAYSNVRGNTQITNVYNKTVINNTTVNNVSFNGGTGGVHAQATTEEVAAQHEQHLPPVAAQVQHEQGASHNPALLASANHGHPPIAATARPAVFTGAGVVAAHGATPVSHTAEFAPHATGSTGGAGGAPAHVTPTAPAHVNTGAAAVVPGASGSSGGPPKGTVPAARIQHTGPPAGAPPPKAPPAKTPPREPRDEHGSEPR
jgi:hypothetical protein